MFCYNCGKKLENDDSFCPGCGKPVRKSNLNEVKETKTEKDSMIKSEEKNRKVKSPIKSLIYKGIVISLAVCVLIEIFLILIGSFSDIHFKVIISMLYIGIFGIFASQYANLYERVEYKNLSLVSISLSVFLFIIFSLIMWEILEINSDFILKIIVSLLIVCVAIYHASKILLINFKNNIAIKFSQGAYFFIAVAYTLGIIWLFTETDNEIFIRIVLVFSILALFTSIATPIANKIK